MKIIVNSYPRSGSTMFGDAIRGATRSLRKNSFEDEFYHNEEWVISNHDQAIFLGTYPDEITICTIIRNPLDAITSNSYRWLNGYIGTTVQGLAIKGNDFKNLSFTNDKEMQKKVDHQINQYISYLSCFLHSPGNIIPFTYEQIINNYEECISAIFQHSDIEKDLNFSSAKHHMENPQQPTGTKTSLYYEIQDYIKSSQNYENAVKIYDLAIQKTKQIHANSFIVV